MYPFGPSPCVANPMQCRPVEPRRHILDRRLAHACSPSCAEGAHSCACRSVSAHPLDHHTRGLASLPRKAFLRLSGPVRPAERLGA